MKISILFLIVVCFIFESSDLYGKTFRKYSVDSDSHAKFEAALKSAAYTAMLIVPIIFASYAYDIVQNHSSTFFSKGCIFFIKNFWKIIIIKYIFDCFNIKNIASKCISIPFIL